MLCYHLDGSSLFTFLQVCLSPTITLVAVQRHNSPFPPQPTPIRRKQLLHPKERSERDQEQIADPIDYDLMGKITPTNYTASIGNPPLSFQTVVYAQPCRKSLSNEDQLEPWATTRIETNTVLKISKGPLNSPCPRKLPHFTCALCSWINLWLPQRYRAIRVIVPLVASLPPIKLEILVMCFCSCGPDFVSLFDFMRSRVQKSQFQVLVHLLASGVFFFLTWLGPIQAERGYNILLWLKDIYWNAIYRSGPRMWRMVCLCSGTVGVVCLSPIVILLLSADWMMVHTPFTDWFLSRWRVIFLPFSFALFTFRQQSRLTTRSWVVFASNPRSPLSF